MAIGSTRAFVVPFRLIVLAVAVLAIVVGVISARPPSQVTIEVGPVGGSYHQVALHYVPAFKNAGIDLQLRSKDNSVEIMHDLADPNSGVDIGFEAQDVSEYRHAPVFTVGHIQLQPLFVFASADLGRRVALTDLRGRKIVMPPISSATSAAAIRMFQLYDITPDNTSFTFLPLVTAASELRAGRYDAGVFMLAPENEVIRGLASYSGLRLVTFAEAKAISQHLPFLRPIVLPRGIYDIADGIPPTDVTMLAGTVDVVVRQGLHPHVIHTLLEAMAEEHRGATFLSNAGDYPTIAGSELTVQPLAQDYYRAGAPWVYRNLPSWLASFVDHYLLIGLALFVAFELYRWSQYLAEIARALLASHAELRARRGAGPVERAKPDHASNSADRDLKANI
jgi:TRAP-type uncharacterized transport system substrate-binding protein